MPNVTSRMGLYFPLPCLLKFLLYSTQFFKLSFSAHFGAEFQSEKGGKKVEITPGTNLKGSLLKKLSRELSRSVGGLK